MSVGLVTACFGGYDRVHPPPLGLDDAVLVTDGEGMDSYPTGYRLHHVPPEPAVPPRRAAKEPKVRPDLHSDAEWLIWADANLAVKEPVLPWAGHPPYGALVAFEHPWITSPQEEAEWALAHEAAKYEGQDLRAQAAAYADRPRTAHVWAGLLAAHRDTWARFGDAWLAEIDKWSLEDQISLPVVLAEHDISVEVRTWVRTSDASVGHPAIVWHPHRG